MPKAVKEKKDIAEKPKKATSIKGIIESVKKPPKERPAKEPLLKKEPVSEAEPKPKKSTYKPTGGTRGAPKRSTEEKRTKKIIVQISPDELEVYTEYARARALKLTVIFRRGMLHYAVKGLTSEDIAEANAPRTGLLAWTTRRLISMTPAEYNIVMTFLEECPVSGAAFARFAINRYIAEHP